MSSSVVSQDHGDPANLRCRDLVVQAEVQAGDELFLEVWAILDAPTRPPRALVLCRRDQP